MASNLIRNSSLEDVKNYSLKHPEWSQAFLFAAFKRISESTSLGPPLMSPWISASDELNNEEFKQVAPRLATALFSEDPSHTLHQGDCLVN